MKLLNQYLNIQLYNYIILKKIRSMNGSVHGWSLLQYGLVFLCICIQPFAIQVSNSQKFKRPLITRGFRLSPASLNIKLDFLVNGLKGTLRCAYSSMHNYYHPSVARNLKIILKGTSFDPFLIILSNATNTNYFTIFL